MPKKSIVIYPGTFDPITNGHIDLVHRAEKIFDKVIIAVANNSTKEPILPLETRVNLAKEVLENHKISVEGFSQLLVDFARECGASYILRGLRAVSDFEYEFQLASMNRHLAPDIETIFLTPSAELSYISSSLVREIARLGGNIETFVPSCVVHTLKKHFQNGS